MTRKISVQSSEGYEITVEQGKVSDLIWVVQHLGGDRDLMIMDLDTALTLSEALAKMVDDLRGDE